MKSKQNRPNLISEAFSNLNDSKVNTTESSKKGIIDRIFCEQETSASNNSLIQEDLKANRMNTLKPRR